MERSFSSLFSAVQIGPMRVKNRLFLAGHGTKLQDGNGLTEAYFAYQERRALGGVGLIVTEILMIDPDIRWNKGSLTIHSDDKIPQYQNLARRLHKHDCRVIGQLFHPGMDRMHDDEGTIPVTYSASVLYNERRKIATREMSAGEISQVIKHYADGARRLQKAGFDGAEVSASHGYLPAQFLHQDCNFRADEWGGSPKNRAKFVREVARAIRERCGPDFAVGVRFSEGGNAIDGLSEEAITLAMRLMAEDGSLDYVSVCDGASSTISASVDNIPPMGTKILAKRGLSKRLKNAQPLPVLVTGRVTYPALADAVISGGDADMVGLVRALICDPDFPRKAGDGKNSEIRTCIGCNQACIGHNHKGIAISCIQNPVTGRELQYDTLEPARVAKRVLIAGGGPAGMNAAVTAARRGHRVTLVEKSPALGGQAKLAQLLPGRSEFGGLISNLETELHNLNVDLRLNQNVDPAFISDFQPDTVILATGGKPRLPEVENDGQILQPWEALQDKQNIGQRVVIADWSCDWVGIGLAEKLVSEGHSVRVAVNGSHPGEMIQMYVRNWMLGRAIKLGAEFHSYLRFFGHDHGAAYFVNLLTDEPVIWEDVDTVIAAYGQSSQNELTVLLGDYVGEIFEIGDCLQPRTAEEAILEGLRVGASL